jgi:hypothetical protein
VNGEGDVNIRFRAAVIGDTVLFSWYSYSNIRGSSNLSFCQESLRSFGICLSNRRKRYERSFSRRNPPIKSHSPLET